MSFKKTENLPPPKPAWDINDTVVRESLKKFEKELQAITENDSEKSLHVLDFWMLQQGYHKMHKHAFDTPYCRVVRLQNSLDGKWYKKVECSFSNKDMQNAREKYHALQKLIGRRRYAQKQEHLTQLAGRECVGTPDSGKRCEICYPLSAREMFAKRGWKFPDFKEVATGMRFPKATMTAGPPPALTSAGIDAGVEHIKKTEVDRETERQLSYDNRLDENGICKKCGFNADECECVDPSKLPF